MMHPHTYQNTTNVTTLFVNGGGIPQVGPYCIFLIHTPSYTYEEILGFYYTPVLYRSNCLLLIGSK